MAEYLYPRVEMENVDKFKVAFSKGVAKISFEAMPSPEILRLLHLSLTGQPLNIIAESPQAELDLVITVVKLKTGEIKEN